MKLFLLATALIISLSASGQVAYTTSTDEQTGSLVFKGPLTASDLGGEPTFKWYKKGMDGYQPDAAAVAYLSTALQKYSLLVFMGTWCDDSQFLIPKLAKVLEAAHFPMDHYRMWGVDRQKQNGGPESATYEIKKVPTIIVVKDGKEVGRIVESVSSTVEADLMAILHKAQ